MLKLPSLYIFSIKRPLLFLPRLTIVISKFTGLPASTYPAGALNSLIARSTFFGESELIIPGVPSYRL